MESRPSAGGGIRVHEDRQHVQERIAELETELLLSQYRRSIDPLTRDVVAQAAIEKKLAERGVYLRSMGESTPPIADSSHDRPKQKRESIREKILSDPHGKIRYDEAADYYGVQRRTIARRVRLKTLGSPSRSFISNASILAYDKKHRLKQL